ncbi:ABC transporter permease subunit [Microbacteriaceae bacterium VKM Ac-2854]|nr:ABC transporter permease subunit [Microbacteriaceae bacterium VKM Ac-2854]
MTRTRTIAVALAHYWPLALVVVAWEAWVSVNGYTSTVAPHPLDVAVELAQNPLVYLLPTGSTLFTALVGLLGGTMVGVVGAVLVWWSVALSGVVTPAALILRSVPITAIIPIVARIVGYGDPAVLTVTVLVCFFPAFVFTLSGLASIPDAGRDLFTVLGARKAQLLLRYGFLHALPSTMVGIRITAPSAVLAAMLAEFLMGTHGLGALFSQSRGYLDMERAWGTALVATALSVLVFVGSRAVERRVADRVT